MKKRRLIVMTILSLLVIFSPTIRAEIVGVFPVDWGMTTDEVRTLINSSENFEYLGEDYTEENYRTDSDYYYIDTNAYCHDLLDGSQYSDKDNDYCAYFVFDRNYRLRMIQICQLSTVKSYYYDLLQRYNRFIKDKDITEGSNHTYNEKWLNESEKWDGNPETMWDYEGYDWAVSLGYFQVTATMESDKTKTKLLFSGQDGTVDLEIVFLDKKYFN